MIRVDQDDRDGDGDSANSPRSRRGRKFALTRLTNGICNSEVRKAGHAVMLTLREGSSRRHIERAGHDTWMTFDPESHRDPFRHGFRALEGLNEDRLAPGFEVPPHSQQNVEMLTYVQEGLLFHEDDTGKAGAIRAGEFQHLSAGSGIRHRRSNGSQLDSAHVIEGKLRPDRQGLSPESVQMRFAAGDRKGVFRLVASPDARTAAFHMHQDVQVYSSLPDRGCHLIHQLKAGRHAWLQVVTGRIQVLDLALIAGDGVAYMDELSVSITALEPSEVLLFDLA